MKFRSLKKFIELLLKEKIKRKGKLNNSNFTGNNKMNFLDMLFFIMGNKGKTLTLELNEYMEKIGKESITKQAFSKQRQNLNPEVFKYLNNELVKIEYKNPNVKTYKGYKILAVDGTMIEMPNSKELKEHYGLTEGQPTSVGRVRGRGIGIYDVLNKIMVRTRLEPCKVSEKEQIEKELKNLKRMFKKDKIILVCDRYFFGLSFIHQLEKLGFKYLIRMKTKDYKKEKEEMKTNDEIVELRVRTNSVYYAKTKEEKEELKEVKKVKTRIIKTILSNNEEEHLATNLTENELSEIEARELYHERWEIEKAFDILKNKIKIENFSSHKVIGVEQDFYAQILVYNLLETIKRETNEEELPKNKKYEYKFNMNIMVGMFKNKFIEIVANEELEEDIMEEFIQEITKYLVPIKPNRNYPRRKMHSMNKYRHNLRKNF